MGDWPGVPSGGTTGVDGLRAAVHVRNAAAGLIYDYAMKARATGTSWKLIGHALGFVGVVWSNPLAWIGAVVILVPAYLRAHRALERMPVDPDEPTLTTPIAVVGPTDGSMVVDAVVTQPIPLSQHPATDLVAPGRRRWKGVTRATQKRR